MHAVGPERPRPNGPPAWRRVRDEGAPGRWIAACRESSASRGNRAPPAEAPGDAPSGQKPCRPPSPAPTTTSDHHVGAAGARGAGDPVVAAAAGGERDGAAAAAAVALQHPRAARPSETQCAYWCACALGGTAGLGGRWGRQAAHLSPAESRRALRRPTRACTCACALWALPASLGAHPFPARP